MRTPSSVEIVDSLSGLAALASEWRDLWQRSPNATPFQSPEWLVPWWRHFHPGALATIAVRRHDRLVGLAPLYIEASASGKRLLQVGISLSDHLDILLDPSEGEAVAAQIIAALAREFDWSLCAFEELAPDAAAFALPCPPGCLETVAEQSACPVLCWQDCNSGLPKSISSVQRRKLRRADRRAKLQGKVDVISVRDDVATFVETLAALHGARWRARGEAGVLADEIVRSFHIEALNELQASGVSRLYLLSIGDKVASAYYGFKHGDHAYAYLSGFDPAFVEESPGALLVAHAIGAAAAEGATEFDFLRGRESYKYLWGAQDRWNRRRCFNRECLV